MKFNGGIIGIDNTPNISEASGVWSSREHSLYKRERQWVGDFVPPDIITTNLRHYYDAANPNSYSGSGTTWVDMGGTPSDATASGGVTYNSTDKVFTFDGVDGHFDVPENYSTNRNVGMTYIVWMRRDGAQSVKAGLVTSTSSSNGLVMGPSGEESELRLLAFSVSQVEAADSNLVTPDGAWCMAAGTMGYTGNWQNKLYLGEESTGVTETGNLYAFLPYPGSVGNIAIGAYDGVSPSSYFKGDIAMVLWYDDILTLTEIEANFDATKGRFFP